MKTALRSVVRHAFTQPWWVRREACVQPDSGRSIARVRSCGFSRKGLAPTYPETRGGWRDHERWAIARRLHGQGLAGPLYHALESWMRGSGARWLRLGVVEGHH